MLDYFKGTVTRNDYIFVAVVLAVAILAYAGFHFVPHKSHLAKVATIDQETRVIQGKLTNARRIQLNIDEFRRKAEGMEKVVAGFRERLPEKREISSMIGQFEARADELGVSVDLSPLPTQPDENKETIPYKVTARGSFHQIVSFMNLLERDRRYIKISNIDIKEEVDGVAESSFTLSTFRFMGE